jgi:hypothetical protein
VVSTDLSIDLDELVPLSKAGCLFPGKPVHPNTLTRWRLHGVKGVRLRCYRVGARWYTSARWVGEFLAALDGQSSEAVQQEPTVDI